MKKRFWGPKISCTSFPSFSSNDPDFFFTFYYRDSSNSAVLLGLKISILFNSVWLKLCFECCSNTMLFKKQFCVTYLRNYSIVKDRVIQSHAKVELLYQDLVILVGSAQAQAVIQFWILPAQMSLVVWWKNMKGS